MKMARSLVKIAHHKLWIFCCLIFSVLFMVSLLSFSRMPGSSFQGALPPLDPSQQKSAVFLQNHVHTLAYTIGPRNVWQPPSMARSIAYLTKELESYGYQVSLQEFVARGKTVSNVEVEIQGSEIPHEIVVIGAHYDTIEGCPGANDNGSGVAVLLELARLLVGSKPKRTIRLVAFANEEPPFFYTRHMGSYHYAQRCRKRNETVTAMVALETVGFYSDEPDSQHYPFPFSFFYPSTADFIGFVSNFGSGSLVRRAIGTFRKHTCFPSEGLAAPGFITGVCWSDHWAFWKAGYPAIMITDTAFFRYNAYHTPFDRHEKLDYGRMARVVSGLVPTVLDLAGGEVKLPLNKKSN